MFWESAVKRGRTSEEIESFLLNFLEKNQIPLYKVGRIATIDLKADEKGILDFCKKYRLELSVYSAHELMNAEGNFTGSDFVKNITGVDNVCERSAVLCSKGRIIVPKTAEKRNYMQCGSNGHYYRLCKGDIMKLYIVGFGPGNYDSMTMEACSVIERCRSCCRIHNLYGYYKEIFST